MRCACSILSFAACLLHKILKQFLNYYTVRMIKSRRMRWAGHVARMGEERGAYSFLVGKPEGKRPLGRPRRRWVDNIRMDLQEVCVGMWTGLGWPRIGTGGGRL